ncbi:hypothetical protein M758_UG084900 [Ceratodon purpureus]|nr:hypothetical protein M758_UG084900 [Ceratodon purpureus]
MNATRAKTNQFDNQTRLILASSSRSAFRPSSPCGFHDIALGDKVGIAVEEVPNIQWHLV